MIIIRILGLVLGALLALAIWNVIKYGKKGYTKHEIISYKDMTNEELTEMWNSMRKGKKR